MSNTPKRPAGRPERDLEQELNQTLQALERAAAEDVPPPPSPEDPDEEQRQKEAYERGETVETFDNTMDLEDAMREARRKAQEQARAKARAEQARRRRENAERADREACETQYSSVDRAAAAYQGRGWKKRGPTAALAWAVGVLAVLFIALSAASVILYQKYNPEAFIEGVMAAVKNQDAAALAALTVSEELTVSEDNARLLCEAFSGKNAQKALKEQLHEQVLDPELPGDYEALSVQKKTVFFGFCDYKLEVSGVQLLLRTDAQNVLMSLNGTARTGEQTDGGILYKNLFPGRYTCAVTGTSAAGQSLTGEATPLDLFTVSSPFVFDGALPMADITVSGAPNDQTTIYINDAEVSQKPVNGTVSLPQVAVGSTISMRYVAEHGAVTTGSVTFTDKNNTVLAFENVKTEGETPSADAINGLLCAYYASFFNAVNNQDAAQATNLTESLRSAVAGQITGDLFKDKIFQFTNAVVNAGAIQAQKVGDKPGFWCNAAVAYHYTEKTEDHAQGDALLYESCEFVFENGAWVLNRTAAIDEAKYNANDLSALGSSDSAASSGAASSSAAQ